MNLFKKKKEPEKYFYRYTSYYKGYWVEIYAQRVLQNSFDHKGKIEFEAGYNIKGEGGIYTNANEKNLETTLTNFIKVAKEKIDLLASEKEREIELKKKLDKITY